MPDRPTPDDFDPFDFEEDDDPDDYDPGEECGRWINGRLDRLCRLAGTEFCDWECPYAFWQPRGPWKPGVLKP